MFTSLLKRNDAYPRKTLSSSMNYFLFSLRMSLRLWTDSLVRMVFGRDETGALDDQLASHGFPPLRFMGQNLRAAPHRRGAGRPPRMHAPAPTAFPHGSQHHGIRPEGE